VEHRLVIEGQTEVESEIVMKGQGRIRDIAKGAGGYLYLLLKPGERRVGTGSVYRLVPAEPN